jgi:hypothetical protein
MPGDAGEMMDDLVLPRRVLASAGRFKRRADEHAMSIQTEDMSGFSVATRRRISSAFSNCRRLAG